MGNVDKDILADAETPLEEDPLNLPGGGGGGHRPHKIPILGCGVTPVKA